VVDGQERLLVLEGLAGGGAMAAVAAVQAWALAEPLVEQGWVARRVVLNADLRWGAGIQQQGVQQGVSVCGGRLADEAISSLAPAAAAEVGTRTRALPM
jgi:hypothetical protein